MARNTYDLSHLAHRAGHIGRIQTVSVIPIEAGSSMSISLDGIARLAPNRKEIVSECQVDLMAFYVPHRIVLGESWINNIKAGPDQALAYTGIAVAAPYRFAPYLCLNTFGATINRTLVEGYNRIFYNFFCPPNYAGNADAVPNLNNQFDWFPTTEAGAENCRLYGRLAARLPHVLNGGNMVDTNTAYGDGWETQDLTDADAEVPIVGGVLDVRDLAAIQSRYRSEAETAWFTHFYQDVMSKKWGTKVGPDTDPANLRPHMLGRQTIMMSGTDIDGLGDANMGTFQGKSLERVRFNMPRKYFNEHGNVFVLALFRYPLVHTREAHPLLQQTNWSYDDIIADPVRWAQLRPIPYDPAPWLAGGSSYVPTEPYQQPYGQHYRFQNNVVHPNFDTIPGYPFSKFNGPNFQDWLYYQNEEYSDTFQTPQIGQWQLQSKLTVMKQSPLPGVDASIFAGAS